MKESTYKSRLKSTVDEEGYIEISISHPHCPPTRNSLAKNLVGGVTLHPLQTSKMQRPRYVFSVYATLVTCVFVCSALDTNIDAATTLKCHLRKYTFKVSNPYRTEAGRWLPCWDNVTVLSCWGRCYSGEVADYRIPYKMSHHPVCTYQRRRKRRVRLRYCHPKHPRKTAIVFDAAKCSCLKCKPEYTSCENLNG